MGFPITLIEQTAGNKSAVKETPHGGGFEISNLKFEIPAARAAANLREAHDRPRR
ncbi:MAG TPA: hypothetical protein VIM46_06940 [Luteolibacter sp.]